MTQCIKRTGPRTHRAICQRTIGKFTVVRSVKFVSRLAISRIRPCKSGRQGLE
jgi:hypothetical protein